MRDISPAGLLILCGSRFVKIKPRPGGSKTDKNLFEGRFPAASCKGLHCCNLTFIRYVKTRPFGPAQRQVALPGHFAAKTTNPRCQVTKQSQIRIINEKSLPGRDMSGNSIFGHLNLFDIYDLIFAISSINSNHSPPGVNLSPAIRARIFT